MDAIPAKDGSVFNPSIIPIAPGTTLVHIMDHGSTYCGYGHGKHPREWDACHSWVRPENGHLSNCRTCQRNAVHKG